MHMSDQREIAAPVAEVWAALLSAEMLKDCVPGATEVSGTPEDGFDAVVTQKVGPVKATFKGRVVLSDIVEGQSLTLSGEGKGGAAGFAKKMADQFFSNLQDRLEGPSEDAGTGEEPVPEGEKKGLLSRLRGG